MYDYDADNRRVRRTVTNGGKPGDSALNGSWEYGYLGWRVVEERAVQASAPAAQYVWGDTLDELWTVDRCDAGQNSVAEFNDGAGDERLFALAGPLYHASGLADETGTLREAWEYTPYGCHTLIADGPDAADQAVNFTADDVRTPGGRSALGNPFLYTGQRHDPETGWHYYKNRYYSPALGRFASRDPIGVWGDEMHGGNAYGYGGMNPVIGYDTFGEKSIRPPNYAPPPGVRGAPRTTRYLVPGVGVMRTIPSGYRVARSQPPRISSRGIRYLECERIITPNIQQRINGGLIGGSQSNCTLASLHDLPQVRAQQLPVPDLPPMKEVRGCPGKIDNTCVDEDGKATPRKKSLDGEVSLWCKGGRKGKHNQEKFRFPNVSDCEKILDAYSRAIMCLNARHNIMEECFEGGDSRHRYEYNRVRGEAEALLKDYEQCLGSQ